MRAAGNILRLVGLLIELGCMIPILSLGHSNRQFAGIRLSQLFFGGIVLGAIVWTAGLFLIVAAPKPKRP
ncbi:MAG TPA: hypothetical protein VGY53_11460 [Isosphaeraceae bacterium]|jgi:hypothetical protein|nr:hypothetical protein [Isosphaeraceae bacterium]